MDYMQNRELSWLKFNERVLSEALDDNTPLMEKLKFISIFVNNLDEFFMVRVGSLLALSGEDELHPDTKTFLSPSKQLELIYAEARRLLAKCDLTYLRLIHELSSHNIHSLSIQDLTPHEKAMVHSIFTRDILPAIKVKFISKDEDFPFIATGKSCVIGVFGYGTVSSFGIASIPDNIPSAVFLPGKSISFIPIDNILLEYSAEIFNRKNLSACNILRITRSADIYPDDEEFVEQFEDFRETMKDLVKKRTHLPVVRLLLKGKPFLSLEDFLIRSLGIKRDIIFYTCTPWDFSFLSVISSRLENSAKEAMTFKSFTPRNIVLKYPFKKRYGDVLLSYPYDSMEPFLELIRKSAYDTKVLSIKITVYRLARNAKLIDYLCEAAENGKDVMVVIELRARFDEQNNIIHSERLENAGVRVFYGHEHYKAHSKLCLITRRSWGRISHVAQIGTGNYNESTVKQYTDLSLITTDKKICNDALEFFRNIAIDNLNGNYKELLVSPFHMQDELMDLIDGEIAKADKGLIVFKVNSISDVPFIHKLVQASCAGVKIYLIVRGICCILPGIEGFTENIKVISILGRFLEHSRIYSFGTEKEQKLFISSADLMTRNMKRRVEIACPVKDKKAKAKLNHILKLMLTDNVKAQELNKYGTYTPAVHSGKKISCQDQFIEETRTSDRNRPCKLFRIKS